MNVYKSKTNQPQLKLLRLYLFCILVHPLIPHLLKMPLETTAKYK